MTEIVYFIGALAFLIFADCEKQEWSRGRCKRSNEEATDEKKMPLIVECKPLKRI